MEAHEPDPTLHVFLLYEAGERVVARTEEHAWEVALKNWGGKREDYEPDGGTFEQVPDEQSLTIFDEDSGERVTRTCRQWADQEGEGLLCSENF